METEDKKAPEGRINVTLDVPFMRGKHTISEIQLRKPSSGELRGLNLQDVLNLDVKAMHKLLPRITAPSMTEQEVSQLDPADLVEISTEVVSFFIRKEKKDEASLLA